MALVDPIQSARHPLQLSVISETENCDNDEFDFIGSHINPGLTLYNKGRQ